MNSNLVPLINVMKKTNLELKKLLELAIRSALVVAAKIPPCDIYVVPRNTISKLLSHPDEIPHKFEENNWLLLMTDTNIKQLINHERLDVSEFQNIVFDKDEEGIITRFASEFVKQPEKNLNHKISPPPITWKDSSFLITKESYDEGGKLQRVKGRATLNIEDIFIDKVILSKTTPRTEDSSKTFNPDDTHPAADRQEWMSENLYILNLLSDRYFSGETYTKEEYKKIEEILEKELRSLIRNNGEKYGEDKIYSAISLIKPDSFLAKKEQLQLKKKPTTEPHDTSDKNKSSKLTIINYLAKILWEKSATPEKYPFQEDITEILKLEYGMPSRDAQCAASMITPDIIKNLKRKRTRQE